MMDVHWSITDGLDVGGESMPSPFEQRILRSNLHRVDVPERGLRRSKHRGRRRQRSWKNETDISSLLSWRGHLSLGYDKTFIMEKKDDG
ncbi:hypothetical protein ACLEEJ_00680 [Lonsdalea quercina]|uniref:hypothetical protein n=2 Tax=Lonsdalea quercina TaxID=71657 RepID=UPI003977082F